MPRGAGLTRAQNDLFYANTALAKLSYRDSAPLEAAFDKARIEYFKGTYYLNAVLSGRIVDHRDSVFHLARATRSYTRSQVYAKQVCEAITPPPSTPEHLGLRAFLGDWGDWETLFEG